MLTRLKLLLSRFDRAQLNHELSSIKSSSHSQSAVTPFFESLKRSPSYQDLTHSELARLKHSRARELQLDRKALWMKRHNFVDPAVQAKTQLKERQRSTEKKTAKPLLYSEPLQYTPYNNKRLSFLESQAERLTLESKLRAEVRKQKLASSFLANTPPPTLASGDIKDPIKRHIALRKDRLQILFKQYIDEYLVHNSSQIVQAHLDNASISVVSVQSPNYRKTQTIKVRVNSQHDPHWVLDKLNVLAPKLRSQIAQRVNLGYMPQLKFEIDYEVRAFDKSRLLKLASQVSENLSHTATTLRQGFETEMNW